MFKLIVEVRLEPAVSVRLDGLNVAVVQVGKPAPERDTVPANPLRLATVTVRVLDWPSGIWIDVGITEIEMSCIATEMLTECIREPV
jgi:hypothetical protein